MEPPSADKLKAIHDLVAGVIGFSAERGDQLIVETLPFETTLNPEPLAPAPPQAPRRASQPGLELGAQNKFCVMARESESPCCSP